MFKHFTQPSITVLSGATGAGKTSTLRDIFLKDYIPCIDNLVLMVEYPDENMYKQLKCLALLKNPKCRFLDYDQNRNVSEMLKGLNSKQCNVLIIDDQVNAKDFELGKIAGVESRHKNCTTFMITQNIFADTKDFLHFRRQTKYFIVFLEGDQSHLRYLSQRIPTIKNKRLPPTRFIIGNTENKTIYDDQWKEI